MPGENPVLNWSWSWTGQLRNTVRVTVQTGGGREGASVWVGDTGGFTGDTGTAHKRLF